MSTATGCIVSSVPPAVADTTPGGGTGGKQMRGGPTVGSSYVRTDGLLPRRLNPRNRSSTAAKPEDSSSTEQGLGKRREGAGNSARLFVSVRFSELQLLKRGTGTGGMEMSMRQTPSAHFTNPFSQKKKKGKKLMGRWHKWCQHPVSQMTAAPTAAAKYARRLACSLPAFPARRSL